MKNLFVTYELALKLKEKEFDEPCLAIYRDQFDDFGITLISDGIRIYNSQSQSFYQSDDRYMRCIAPLYQQVVDWFREKHNIHIEVKLGMRNSISIYRGGIYESTKALRITEYYDTYYKALTGAIEGALKLI